MSEIAKHVEGILDLLEVDKTDMNYLDTPRRVARMLIEDFTPKPFAWATFNQDYNQMVVMRNHITFTRCPHHLERVRLNVSIGYIPNKRLLGLSKLPRLADSLAVGCNLQEALTNKIAEELWNVLNPLGVGVFVLGQHNCMQARGVHTTGDVITSSFRGCMLEEGPARAEFLDLIRR